MALPVTLTGALATTRRGFLGPIKASNGAFYIFTITSTAGTVAAYKASDPTSSFSSVATVSVAGAALLAVTAAVNGSIIDVYARLSGGVRQRHVSFTPSTDSFGTPVTVDSNAQDGNYSLSAAARSDGDKLLIYNGPTVLDMSTAYSRATYARYEGTSWTNNLGLFNVVTIATQFRTGVGIMGSADRLHCIFKDHTNSDLFLSTVLSDNTFGQSGTTTPAAATIDATVHTDDFPIGNGCFADSKIWAPYKDASGRTSVVSFTDADNPSMASVITADVGANTVKVNAVFTVIHQIVAEGTTVHLLYVGSSDDHLYHSSLSAGGAWGAEVDEKTLTGCTQLSATVYNRGGADVIGLVWWNGTALVYDEIALAAPATSFLFPPHRPSMMSVLVR